MKNVCIISSFLPPHLGGVERFIQNFSRELTINGYNVVLIGLNTEKLKDYSKEGDITIIRMPCFLILNKRYPIPIINIKFLSLLKKINQIRFDFIIINARFYFLSIFAAFYAKKHRIPALVLEHGTGHFSFDNKIIEAFARWFEHIITNLYRFTDVQFFGVSQACCNWLSHFSLNASGIIYNGVDSSYKPITNHSFRDEHEINQEDIVVTFCGRLIKEKGIIELINGFNELQISSLNYHLMIAGDGTLYNMLTEEFNAIRNIHFLGRIDFDYVMKLLSESDIVVLPTQFPEGLPTIILEAGLNNCAVITTPKGGATEVIIDADYGIVIPDNEPTRITHAISTLILDEEQRKSLAFNLNKRVKNHFDWSVIVRKFINKVLIKENNASN